MLLIFSILCVVWSVVWIGIVRLIDVSVVGCIFVRGVVVLVLFLVWLWVSVVGTLVMFVWIVSGKGLFLVCVIVLL